MKLLQDLLLAIAIGLALGLVLADWAVEEDAINKAEGSPL